MSKAPWNLLSAALIATLACAGLWQRDHVALRVQQAEFAASTLHPLAALLKDNRSATQELQSEPFVEAGAGILESYLVKIRRDGVAKHADMKQRLDQLAENNAAILTLIQVHEPRAKVPSFQIQSGKFRNYASAWRDRWTSVMELYMAGGHYAVSAVPFPKEFPQAVEAEIAAAK